MLERFVLLFSILGGWIASIILIIIFKIKWKKELPTGSIKVEADSVKNEVIIPGYNPLLLVGLGSISFLTVFVLFLCIFDFWNTMSNLIAIDFPSWINWSGIIGLWISACLGGFVFAYNANYTAATKPLKKDYILATGGPYKFVRHPMYIIKSFQVVFFFIATGIWFALIGIITWFVISTQAEMEEKALIKKFGNRYEEYLKKTNRFFPKLKKK